jgi:hypothetical protein
VEEFGCVLRLELQGFADRLGGVRSERERRVKGTELWPERHRGFPMLGWRRQWAEDPFVPVCQSLGGQGQPLGRFSVCPVGKLGSHFERRGTGKKAKARIHTW